MLFQHAHFGDDIGTAALAGGNILWAKNPAPFAAIATAPVALGGRKPGMALVEEALN
jgi:hypothetical protein